MAEIKAVLSILLLNKKRTQIKSRGIQDQNLMSSSWFNNITLPVASFSSEDKSCHLKIKLFLRVRVIICNCSRLYSSDNFASHSSHQCPVLLQNILQEWRLISRHSCSPLCCSNFNKANRFLPQWHFKRSNNKSIVLI